MNVTAKITLSADEISELSTVIGCTREQLAERLQVYASAAVIEYVTMMLGQRVFRRATDIHEYRLLLLIKYVFKNEIPDEQAVCHLFQCTPTESRSLIRSVMAKYQYQLKSAIETSMIKVVESAVAVNDGDPYIVAITSRNVVDALNTILAERDGSLQTISKKHGSISEYVISPASHEALCQRLGIPH